MLCGFSSYLPKLWSLMLMDPILCRYEMDGLNLYARIIHQFWTTNEIMKSSVVRCEG